MKNSLWQNCLRYLADTFDDEAHRPGVGTIDYVCHEELLDYVESSFADVALKLLLAKLGGQEPPEEALVEMKKHYDYVAQHLPEDGLLFGKTPMLADIQFSYLLANLSQMRFLDNAPRLESYWSELQQQTGYRAVISKTGPMAPDL